MKVTEITGYFDDGSSDVADVINERIETLESHFDVRVISIDVNKGGASKFGSYSVWLELQGRY